MKTKFLLIVLSLIGYTCFAQNQYPEAQSPASTATGVYYQGGPGSNNGSLNWSYPYGTKLTVNGGVSRNFEISTTTYPNGALKLRQWDTSAATWTSWRDILTANANGNVGIGTSTPYSKLEIRDGNIRVSRGSDRMYLDVDDQNAKSIIAFGDDAVDRLALYYDHWNGTASDKEVMSVLASGNVGIGTTTPDARLAVNGNIHAREVKVDLTGWPDYVFQEDYDLPTLEEVAKHIKEKGHLINIPSAPEVAENGIQLGEMNKLLLEKIEELTLHLI